MSLIEIFQRFPDHEACLEHLETVRWGNEPNKRGRGTGQGSLSLGDVRRPVYMPLTTYSKIDARSQHYPFHRKSSKPGASVWGGRSQKPKML